MLRSINVKAATQKTLSAAPSLGSARRLSQLSRPSSVALGKRPLIAAAPRSAIPLGLAGPSPRHFSWTPWKSTTPSAPPAAPEIVNAAVSSTSTTLPPPSVPSSDIPSIPAELPLAPASHLTSTSPDHHFHSDPTPLLPQPPADAFTPTLEDLVTNSGLPLEQVLNSPEAVHAAIKVSDLSLVGLDHCVINLVGWVRDGIVATHLATGLPWWASIAALTVSMRLCLFPMVIRNLKHNQRLAAVSPQMQGLMKRLTEAKQAKDQTAMMVTQNNLQQLMKENDVSPFRPLLMPLLQMPFFLSMFYGLRGLANTPLPQLKEGGFSWVLDLTAADPYFILPITSVALQLAVLQLGADGTGAHQTASSARQMTHMKNVLITISPLMVGMISQFPAAVLFYWTTTNVFTVIQASLLRQQFIRDLLRIPTPPKVIAPPNDAIVNTKPSISETWKAIREFHRTKLNEVQQRQAEAKAQAQVEAERQRGARPGTGLLAERVQEPRRAEPMAATAFLEEGATVAAGDAVATADDSPLPSAAEMREAAKRRRIEAARAKRAKQQ